MLTIPQFLEFPTTEDTSALVSFFLKLLEHKNRGLFLHSQQVANYAVCTAIKMGLPLSEVAAIKTAALLHDIGMVSVPNTILAKYPYFNVKERAAYRRHCLAGASMMENIPGFGHIMKMVLHHHEHWDGSGYPKRLKGVNIPLGARIIAVCDYYDRRCKPCTHNWQWQSAVTPTRIRDLSGIYFDPDVVKAFFDAVAQNDLILEQGSAHA